MRFSLDSALFILALAHSFASPVSANEGKEPKRHMFRRATHGFHKSALRHSAGLAQDLRVALKGLGSANTPRAPVKARSNLGSSKPYCVPTSGRRQTNSSANWNPFGNPPASSSANPSATRSSKTSPTSSPGGQSAFKLAQSYVSDSQYGARIASARVECRKKNLLTAFFDSAVWQFVFPRMGLFHRQRSDQWSGTVR